MAKKEVGLVELPHGHIGAFFSKNCLYNLHALQTSLPLHESKELVVVKWPGQVDPPAPPSKQK
jgi:hypothetical protein